jgi:DNA replication protein DnaC
MSTIDTARLSLLLNELRLPAIKALWPQFAEQSDKEGWPAARFLAAIAEHEVAERGRRRIERHLTEARLPPGKTFDNFDFEAVPMVSKAQLSALAAGDSWLSKGANLLLFGPPGGGKTHLATALGLALIENGWRHPHHRPRTEAPGRPARAQPRGRHQPARSLRPPHSR